MAIERARSRSSVRGSSDAPSPSNCRGAARDVEVFDARTRCRRGDAGVRRHARALHRGARRRATVRPDRPRPGRFTTGSSRASRALTPDRIRVSTLRDARSGATRRTAGGTALQRVGARWAGTRRSYSGSIAASLRTRVPSDPTPIGGLPVARSRLTSAVPRVRGRRLRDAARSIRRACSSSRVRRPRRAFPAPDHVVSTTAAAVVRSRGRRAPARGRRHWIRWAALQRTHHAESADSCVRLAAEAASCPHVLWATTATSSPGRTARCSSARRRGCRLRRARDGGGGARDSGRRRSDSCPRCASRRSSRRPRRAAARPRRTACRSSAVLA